ncbi:MAG: hypothetical protein WBD27_13635 [Pyrinomonadaceae bacterium]
MNGNLIPFSVDTGQIAWSARGNANKTVSARSEQISISQGVASTYSCYNCCQNSFYWGWIDPYGFFGSIGDTQFLSAIQQDVNCYNQPIPTYPAGGSWAVAQPSIADFDLQNRLEGLSFGDTYVTASWTADSFYPNGPFDCIQEYIPVSAQGPVQVVTVQKIQYKGPNNSAYADATGTLYVLKDTEVSFKAIPNPSTATFPSGQPVWSGTSGATGTGQTKSVTFSTVSSSTSNFKTVVATAGNSSMTVNVVVYDLEKVIAPVETWTGRATTTFGLKELVNLSTTITPSGVTSTQAGGLEWGIASGTGTVESHADNNGTGSFTAPAHPGNTTLKMNVVSGPSKDRNVTQDVTTIKPSGTNFALSTGRKHTQGRVSAGFKAIIYFEPKTVSFKNIAFSEGACDAQTAGYLSSATSPHAAGQQSQILLCNGSTGCRGFNEDTCYMFHPENPSPTPYGSGSKNWPIPWSYHYGSESGSLFIVNQLLTSDASGNATISKGGVSVTFNVNDATIETGGTW